MRISRLMFWVFTVALTVGALLFGATFMNSSWVLLTIGNVALLLGGYALMAYAIARAREMGHLPRLLAISLVAALIGCTSMIGMIWALVFSRTAAMDRWLAIIGAPATSLTAFGALAGLLTAIRLPNTTLIWIRRCTIAMAGLLAAFISVIVFMDPWLNFDARDVLARIASTITVFIGGGVLTIVATVYLHRLRGRDAPIIEPLDMTLTCPRCKLRQTIKTEGSRCEACKLGIKVSLT
ncbi:MAG TPA: hypothetical protein PK400_02520 [Phycisphaerales bacterium]|nr:hypothetical protein [Phycisphaerales bacterium]HRQ75389.1 hypothetical protein [Phycisphaerales bacterium]